MKKLIIRLGLLMALPLMALQGYAAIPAYDQVQAKANAQNDFANWMKYLPDEVFVAHVSIPGTHDTATGHGFCHSGTGVGGATYSQTQMASIDDQLAGGVRAFDFRPGVYQNKLYCCHGTDVTNYTMEEAFTKLTNYLDEHPGEFFVIHLFRGNVGYSGTGMNTSESDRTNYNNLINEFFNKGKFSEYIIDYNPTLKVKDIRGKMVLFRRDTMDFAHFAKAANFGEWPWEDDVWAVGHARERTEATHASDPSVRGYVRVSDMSSPDNTTQIDQKMEAVSNLYNWCTSQARPNSVKDPNKIYRPDWCMTFTSGEYKGVRSGFVSGGRSGYAYCANKLNPHYTNLINNTPEDKKGPCGIVLSDWVLTDYSQDNQYQVYGNELIPAIAYNNFDYIQEFILDDALFTGNEKEIENIWDSSKQYFMRNVGTGDFLSAGEWYGTHAVTAAHGIKVTPIIDSETGKYKFKTTLTSNGYLDNNYYVDNGGGAGIRELDAKYAGSGKYVFTYQDNDNNTKAIAAVDDIWGEFCYDGTTHNVDPKDFDISDPYQQWELISVDDYTKQQLQKARRDKGSDVSHLITGGRFFAHDSENDTWSKTGGSKSTKEVWGFGPNESRRALVLYNVKKSGWTWDASWTVTKNVTNLPKGRYEIKFKAYRSNTNGMTVTINNSKFDNTNLVQGAVSPVNNTKKETAFWGWDGSSGYLEDVGADIKDDKFTYSTKQINITDGKITIKATASSNDQASAGILEDFELIYYGSIYPILERAIEDAKRRLGSTPDWLATYETNMNNMAYDESDEGAAPALEIYQKMRELTLAQTPDDNKHQDYTNAFINAGFETGTLMGWETTYAGEGADTGVRPNEGVYATQDGVNQFLFNCWQEDPNPDNRGRGVILSQTIPGLPAGHYLVTARAANDEGDCMYIEVNGQRSDALVVEEANNISKLISFEFEVAENTEEVTISFMGGNSDGTFDDYGGNWFKVDDIHLYRSGSADYCVFYRRLLAAMERTNVIAAKTLPQYYQDKWDNEDYHKSIADLIQTHLDSGHSGDLGGSNGLEERTQLFEAFSQVVLSQAETKANMSGAIRNNSFELGDLSYWTTKASPIAMANVTDSKDDVYNISGRDEKHIYYANLHNYEDYNGEAYPIYQTVSGLPKGQYRLSVSVASNNGNTFYLAANGTSKKITTSSESAFQTEEVEFEITADNSDLTLGLYPSADGSFTSQEANAEVKGPWFAVDNFELWLVGRQVSINWTMETPTHGTIILPFAVDAEELAEKGLEVYSVTAHVESTAEGATHHILEYTQQPAIEAHTPYLVKRADAGVEVSSKAVKTAGKRDAKAAKGDVYTFEGFTENEKMVYTDTYSNGNLVGVLVETGVADNQYHLQNYEDNIGFVRHEDADIEHDTFEPYHAYITIPKEHQGDVNIHGLYFEEPTLPLDWYMEGENYGTIILPFDAEVPADLNAYTLTAVGEKKAFPGVADTYYHMLTTEAVEEVDGVRTLAANVPYLVVRKSAEEAQTPVEPAMMKLAPRAAEDEKVPTATFKGQAINTTESNTVGILTGVHVDKAVAADEPIHVITEDETTGAFATNESMRLTQIDAHHAYVAADQLPPDHGDYLLLVEPKAEEETGVEEIMANGEPVDIFTPAGVVVRRQVSAAEALRELAPGVYVLRSEKVSVKVIKR